MRLKRVHSSSRNGTGKHRAPRSRHRRLLPASTVAAAIALGYVATTAAHDAAPVGGFPDGDHPSAPAALGTGIVDPAVRPYVDPKQLAAVTVGPEHVAEPVRMVLASARVTAALDESGIPDVALAAYQRAAQILAAGDPGCHLPWQLLAAIGRVESNHGRFGDAMLRPDGYGTRPIRGIPLDGRAHVALIRDTDGGRLDGDPNFDRAVGPMQFIPSTWATYGVDANGDGKRDPDNIFDAALGAAVFLCTGGGDLTDPAQEAAAVRRYNNADEYVRVVLALAASYEHGDAATLPTTGTVGATPPVVESAPGLPPGRGPGFPPSPPAGPAPHATTKTTVEPTRSSAIRGVPAPPPTHAQTPSTAIIQTPASSPTHDPSGGPSAMTPSATSPTDTTQPEPMQSEEPTQVPEPSQTPSSPTPSSPAGQTANIGWAPAMRQVVVTLLTEPPPRHGSSKYDGGSGEPPRPPRGRHSS